jgi:hypothetical protein
MTSDPPKLPKHENALPRKWKQSEALRAAQILKKADLIKWNQYLDQELNEAQIDNQLFLWILKTLEIEFESDLRELSGLIVKMRANVNPKWSEYAGDDL